MCSEFGPAKRMIRAENRLRALFPSYDLIEARIGSTARRRGSGRAVSLLHDASLHRRIWNEATNPFRRENGRIGEPMLFARGSRGFGKPSFDARRSA